MDQSMPGQEVQ